MRKIIKALLVNKIFVLLVLLSFGVLIRIYNISVTPSGLNQDEASIGYEAYSILKYGIDRNGHTYPIHLESWGSGQNALYAYLSMPFIEVLGLNVFSVRIVNLIFGCITFILFFLIFKKEFGFNKGLIALIFIIISPWSIMSARWGLESNLFPAIVLIGVYFLINALRMSNQIYFATAFFGISLYAYGTSYLFIPIFILVISYYLYSFKLIASNKLIVALTLLVIIAVPMVISVIINHFECQSVNFLGITIPKLSVNRTLQIFNLFSSDIIPILIKNGVRLLGILLLQVDGNEYNSIPMFGTLYHISIPFLIIGIYSVLKNGKLLKNKTNFIFFVWLMCSFILGLCIHANINRLNIIFIPLIYFSVLGLIEFQNMIKPELISGFRLICGLIYVVYFVFFIGYYFNYHNNNIKNTFSNGLGEAILYATKLQTKGTTIHITNTSINMPYIYVCFYDKINPNEFVNSVSYLPDNGSGFREVKQFGKFTFGDFHSISDSIYILGNDEFKYGHYSNMSYTTFGDYTVLTQLKH